MTRVAMSGGSDTANLRAEVRALLRNAGIAIGDEFRDDRSLIRAGLLDSVALFEIVLWTEAKTGQGVDPQSIDIAREWDSIDRIVEYVARARARAPSPAIITPPPPPPATTGVTRHDEQALRIVRYDSGQKETVARFLTGLWSRDEDCNRRCLEWKYERNPLNAQPRMYLAYIGDEVIASRGFYPSRWELGSPAKQHTVLVADDALVDERVRNQSVMHRLMRVALDELHRDGEDFVFNLTGGPVTVLSSLAMGWKSSGAFEPLRRMSSTQRVRRRMRKVLASSPVLWRYADRTFLHVDRGDPFERFDRLPPMLDDVPGVNVVAAREPRTAEMAKLISRIGHDGRLRHVRDAQWLEWRLRNPLADYRFLYAGSNHSLEGYAIFRSRGDHHSRDNPVHLVDLEAIDERTRAALLRVAARPGLFDELRAWSATLRPADVGALTRAGFRPFMRSAARLSEPCVLVRATATHRPHEQWVLDGISLLQPGSWDMRMLYTMAG